MKLTVLLWLVVLFFSIPPSLCQANNGFYLGFNGGPTVVRDTSLSGEFNPIELDFSTGYFLGANAGYQLVNGRLEIEYSFRSAVVDKTKFLDQNFNPGGELRTHSVLINSIAEYNRGQQLRPYILVGAGYASMSLEEDLNLGIDIVDSKDWVFAYQGGAGIGIALSRGICLDLGYRYFATEDLEFEATAGRKIKAEYETHNLLAGLRFAF